MLFLGNPLLSDDRIGLELGTLLKDMLEERGFDVVIVEKMGLTLLDYIQERDLVFLVDSVKTGKHPVGTVFMCTIDQFPAPSTFSPHYAGLPEVLSLLKILNTVCEVQVIAIEVKDPYTIGEQLSLEVKEKLRELAERVYNILNRFIP